MVKEGIFMATAVFLLGVVAGYVAKRPKPCRPPQADQVFFTCISLNHGYVCSVKGEPSMYDKYGNFQGVVAPKEVICHSNPPGLPLCEDMATQIK